MDVSFFFSRNKDSDGDNKRGSLRQMMSAAEDGSCGKQKRLIMGGRWWEASVLYSATLRSSWVPLSAQQRNYSALEEAGCTEGLRSPVPALFWFYLFHFTPPGSDEDAVKRTDSSELQVTPS